MQLSFNERQQDLYGQFSELGRPVALSAPENDKVCRLDTENWQKISHAGIWRLPVPTRLGGAGGSWLDCVAAIEGVASTAEDLGFMITMLGHVGALRILLYEGTPEQQQRWLDRLMSGEIGITAMTEDTGGSDLARMRVAAREDEAGWRLSGRKSHITNAPVAAFGMIAGRIPSLGDKRDIALFFVDLDTPGVSLGRSEDNLGIRTSPTADLILDGVPLRLNNIIGTPGDGLRILCDIISFERALYGVIASGLIEGMIKKAMARVESRWAFNRPLADYQYVQGRITDMKIAATVCRFATYAAFGKIESKTEDASIACSIAKFLAGEHLLASAEHLVQLHGHLGFMNNDLSRQLRDAVGMRIAGGTSDIQRINIFNQLRRLNKKPVASPLAVAAE